MGNATDDMNIWPIRLIAFEKALKIGGLRSHELFRPGAKVLEIGAGPGQNQWMLRQKFPGLDYTEVEIDKAVAEISRERNPDGKVVTESITQHIDTVPNGTLDVIVGFNSLDQYTSRQLQMLMKKTHAKLRDGGAFIHTIDQTQAPTPMRTYLDDHGRAPGDQGPRRSSVVVARADTYGRTTHGIYLGPKKVVEAEIERYHSKGVSDEIKGKKYPLARNEFFGSFTDEEFLRIDRRMASLGLEKIDHNDLLARILEKYANESFRAVNKCTVLEKRPRAISGDLHGVMMYGDFADKSVIPDIVREASAELDDYVAAQHPSSKIEMSVYRPSYFSTIN